MVWPGNRLTRVVASAAIVANTVAIAAATSASQSDRIETSITFSLAKAASYQRSEKPPHWLCDCSALKEKTTRITIGT